MSHERDLGQLEGVLHQATQSLQDARNVADGLRIRQDLVNELNDVCLILAAVWGEIGRLLDCQHLDFRDTLDGGVCNDCGLEVVTPDE